MNSEISAVLEDRTKATRPEAVSRKKAIALYLLIPATALLTLVFALPMLSIPPGRDQGTYLQIGQSLLEGKHLYVDLWDNKPPGIFIAYAAVAKLFGRVMWSVALVDVLLLLAISWLLFRFTERYIGRAGAALAVVIHAGLHSEMAYFSIAQPETFQALAMLAAYLVLIRDSRWKLRCFAGGLICGFGFWQKYNFIAFLPLLLVLPFLEEGALDRRPARFRLRIGWREWSARTALVTSGFALAVIVVIAYIAFTGGLAAMREGQVHALSRYAEMAITNNPHYLAMAFMRTYLSLHGSTLYAALATLIIGWLSRDLKRMLPIFLAFAASVAATIMQVRFHAYYFQVCFPFVAALWAYLAIRVYEGTRGLATALNATKQKLSAVLVWVVFANLVFWPIPNQIVDLFLRYQQLLQWRTNREVFYANFPNPLSIELLSGQIQVMNYVNQNTDRDDKIYVWGANPLIYFITGRQPPTRFVLNLGVIAKWGEPAWKDELMNGIEAGKPRLIVVTRGDALPTITYVDMDSEQYLHAEFPRLDNYIRRNYTEARQFDGFTVYTRNQ